MTWINTKSYDFQKQVNDPKQKEGNKLAMHYLLSLGEEIRDVSENPDYYKGGVDLIRVWPDREEYIDVKTDFMAHKTGNIPIELTEVVSAKGVSKLGWYYTNNEIIYLIYETKELIHFKKDELTDIFSKPYKGYASHHIKPFPYFTMGILLPLEEIKDMIIKL